MPSKVLTLRSARRSECVATFPVRRPPLSSSGWCYGMCRRAGKIRQFRGMLPRPRWRSNSRTDSSLLTNHHHWLKHEIPDRSIVSHADPALVATTSTPACRSPADRFSLAPIARPVHARSARADASPARRSGAPQAGNPAVRDRARPELSGRRDSPGDGPAIPAPVRSGESEILGYHHREFVAGLNLDCGRSIQAVADHLPTERAELI